MIAMYYEQFPPILQLQLDSHRSPQNHLVCKQTLNHLAKLFIYEKVVLGSSLVAVTYKPQNWLAGNAKLAVKPNQVSCGI